MKRQLTEAAIKRIKLIGETDKNQKHTDGGGLYLFVTKTGKFWRYDYKNPKRDTMSLGEYPSTTLEQARVLHEAARKLSLSGINPKDEKKSEARQERINNLTFRMVAEEWLEKASSENQWSVDYRQSILDRLELHVYPWIGKRPIVDIDAPELAELLKRITDQNKHETANRIKSLITRVLQYARLNRIVKVNEARELDGLIKAPKEEHYAAIINPDEVSALLRCCHAYSGKFTTKIALLLSAYLFQRPGEIRSMEWKELDFSRRLWIIPAEKMKAGKEHIVPLSTQVMAWLEEIRPLTERYPYVFPSATDPTKQLSENTVRSALRRMGYDNGEMTAHGFRTMASTLLYEMGFDEDLVERCLAHSVGNNVRQAYDRSRRLKERVDLMQTWADYLDSLTY